MSAATGQVVEGRGSSVLAGLLLLSAILSLGSAIVLVEAFVL